MFPEKQSGSVIFSVSDHGLLPGLAFSDFRDDVFLVPDAHFIDSRGYVEQRAHYDSDNVPWHQRKPVALWRGSAMRLTGPDLKPISGAPLEAHRIKLCVIARDPNTARFLDAGLTANFNFSTIEYAEFENAGLTANRVNYRDFTKYRYQIDIDGISNAWAALFWKLLTGSAVLKVESPAGFKQWYYGDLKPWVHYVPVAADLSDLVDRIRWLQAHDDQAREIGRNGRALAQAMTYDSALDSAMPTIGAAFRYFGD